MIQTATPPTVPPAMAPIFGPAVIVDGIVVVTTLGFTGVVLGDIVVGMGGVAVVGEVVVLGEVVEPSKFCGICVP